MQHIIWSTLATLIVTLLVSNRLTAAADSCNIYPDLFYEYQLALLDQKTTISYDFTPQVKRYLQIYIDTRKQQVADMLALSELYFPIIDNILKSHNLPLELKYLAAVESALDPCVVSRSNAVGLWQFKINSGQLYGLNVSEYTDDRMDPAKSTEAACKYLEDLYKQFGNWHLALAAYNIGPTALQSIIKKNHGETNFWKLYPKLPEAAQNYVPAFIAATYIMKNPKTHGISASTPTITLAQTDTIAITNFCDFSTISSYSGIPIEMLTLLNPQFIQKIIPKHSTIRIPSNKKAKILNCISQIYSNSVQPPNADKIASSQKWISHTVIPGDSMIKIANAYNCTINDLRQWNPEIDTTLNIGTKIKIQVSRL